MRDQVGGVGVGALDQRQRVLAGAPLRVDGLKSRHDFLQHVGVPLPLGQLGDALEAFRGFRATCRVVTGHPLVRVHALAELSRMEGGGAQLGPPHGVGPDPDGLAVLGDRVVIPGLAVGSIAQTLVVGSPAASRQRGGQREPRDSRGSPRVHSPDRPSMAR